MSGPSVQPGSSQAQSGTKAPWPPPCSWGEGRCRPSCPSALIGHSHHDSGRWTPRRPWAGPWGAHGEGGAQTRKSPVFWLEPALLCTWGPVVLQGWEPGTVGQARPALPPPQVQSELLRRWNRWRAGRLLQEERHSSRLGPPARPTGDPPSEKPLLSRSGGSSNGTGRDPCADPCLVSSLPGLAESPF